MKSYLHKLKWRITINKSLYDTDDMSCAASLLCAKYELIEIEQPNYGGRATFRFKYADDLHETANDHWNGRLRMPTSEYWAAIKMLKTRLYSQKG